MAKIKKIYDDSARTTQVYPQTHEKAVIDNNGVSLDSKLGAIVDMVNQKQMEVGTVPFDLEPTEGNTTHVVSSDVVARGEKNLSEGIDEAKELVNGTVSHVMKSDMVTVAVVSETYIEKVSIVSGHVYRLTMKTDSLLTSSGTTTVIVIVSSNGQKTIGKAEDIYQDGVTIQFTATSTGVQKIYQYSPSNQIAGVGVHMEIEDLSDEPSINCNVDSGVIDKTIAKVKVEGLPEESCNMKVLYTRGLANNQLSWGGFQPSAISNGMKSPFYVSMTNYLALPYRGVRIYLKAPDDITARVVIRPWSTSATALSSTTLNNGEYVDAHTNGLMYIVEFHRRGEGFTPQDLYEYMDSGQLMLYYHDDSGNVVVRNSDAMRYVNCIRGDGEVVRDYATFVHGTDIHGDEVRLNNILRFADLIKPTATLLSGDHVAIQYNDGTNFFNDCLMKWRHINPFICIGNHDSNDVANSSVYSTHVAPLAETFGWMKDADNVTDACWFYKDITDKRIRLISLDMYEYGGTTFYKVFFSQAQIDWFVETLQSVPEDYAVLIVQHSMERQAVPITGKEEWWGDVSSNLDYGGITGGYVIQDIMDAWIGKTTINKTYTQPAKGSTTNTFTAEADFSEDASNEFIGYVSGHTHIDCIGYADGTAYRQLIMCCTCACPWRGQTGRVYPRGLQGVTQDSFNVYAIDRTNKQVRIAKVGSNMKMDFTETKYTIVDYDNVEN